MTDPAAGRLVLWDVDSTLVRVGPVGAEVFEMAVEQATGHRPTDRVVMHGKTDPQILGEYLAMLAVDEDPDLLPVVLGHLADNLAAAEEVIRRDGRVLPGVAAALERLHDHPDVVQTVLTGNIAPNAAVKVGAFGLDRWLDLRLGAFGSDDADRRRLVPIALGRVADRTGVDFAPDQVWVVGDSPNDLACARAAGVRCLLVATGFPTFDELAALAPEAVRRDLSDTDDVVDLLLG